MASFLYFSVIGVAAQKCILTRFRPVPNKIKKMKFIFIGLALLHGLVLTTVSTQQIKVRSHGDKQIKAQKQDIKERTYEAVLGLNVSPRNRLRVRTRNPKDATDTLAAAEAAGIKAKEIRQKNRLSYRDLDSFETSLIPVRI